MDRASELRERRRRLRNRFRSQARASDAMKQVIAETGASGISGRAVTKEILPRGYEQAVAWSSNPVTFTVGPSGRLKADLYGGALATARHEVAHLLGAGHLAIRVTDNAAGPRGPLRAAAVERSGMSGKMKAYMRWRRQNSSIPRGEFGSGKRFRRALR